MVETNESLNPSINDVPAPTYPTDEEKQVLSQPTNATTTSATSVPAERLLDGPIGGEGDRIYIWRELRKSFIANRENEPPKFITYDPYYTTEQSSTELLARKEVSGLYVKVIPTVDEDYHKKYVCSQRLSIEDLFDGADLSPKWDSSKTQLTQLSNEELDVLVAKNSSICPPFKDIAKQLIDFDKLLFVDVVIDKNLEEAEKDDLLHLFLMEHRGLLNDRKPYDPESMEKWGFQVDYPCLYDPTDRICFISDDPVILMLLKHRVPKNLTFYRVPEDEPDYDDLFNGLCDWLIDGCIFSEKHHYDDWKAICDFASEMLIGIDLSHSNCVYNICKTELSGYNFVICPIHEDSVQEDLDNFQHVYHSDQFKKLDDALMTLFNTKPNHLHEI